MIEYENQCVGCPPEMGCIGDSCPYANVPVYYCDECHDEVNELYDCDGDELCEDCLLKQFERIDYDDEVTCPCCEEYTDSLYITEDGPMCKYCLLDSFEKYGD